MTPEMVRNHVFGYSFSLISLLSKLKMLKKACCVQNGVRKGSWDSNISKSTNAFHTHGSNNREYICKQHGF